MTREKYESLPLATLKELAKARKMKGVSTLKSGEAFGTKRKFAGAFERNAKSK